MSSLPEGPPQAETLTQQEAHDGAILLRWMAAWSRRESELGELAEVERTFRDLTSPDRDADQEDRSAWWEATAEAALNLELRPSVIDASVDQVLDLVLDGADVATFHPTQGWLGVHGSGQSFEVWRSGHPPRSVRRTAVVRRMIAGAAEDERLRIVAIDRHNVDLETDASHRKPIDRLKALLRPELSDIVLVVIFAFAVGILTLATPIAVESLVNTVAFGRYLQPIVVLALVLLTFLGFSAAISALQTYVVEVIQQRLFARVATDLAHRLPRVSTEATDDTDLHELTNRFFDVVTIQKVSAKLLLEGISLVLTAGIGMAVLAFYHPFLLGFDIILMLAIAMIVFVLGRGAIKTAIQESKSKYYMASWLEDIAGCPTTFRSAAGKRLASSRADHLIHGYLKARQKHFRVLLRQILFALSLQAIASTVLLGLGGWLVVFGELTLGQLVAAELIVAVIVGAFAKLGKHMESFYDLLASVDKLGALLDLPSGRRGGMLMSDRSEPAEVTLNDVRYASAFSRRTLAGPVSAQVPAGEMAAVYGAAASGKSTLLDLIYGFRRPSKGTLLVNGRSPTDVQADDFREWVELVRDGELFTGSIEENVHLHRGDVASENVIDALADVGLLDTIRGLPDGLDTHLKSGKIVLSSGQRKLLLLARALASNPRLILVDGLLDSFEFTDVESLIAVLGDRHRQCTVIIATSRRDIANLVGVSVELQGGVESISGPNLG